MKRRLILWMVLLIPGPTLAEESPLPRDGQRVLFLGDSITQAGLYVTYIDAYLFTRHPERTVEVINLGLASETCSGLSEKDHPFPRPDVHTRLDRALERVKPDVVVACYGMNDGIYAPPSEERTQAYRAGLDKLITKANEAGATVTLMTPPPFDPVPIREKLAQPDADEFGFRGPYPEYDQVLATYGKYVLSFTKKGIPVADPHTAVNSFLKIVREQEPTFSVAGDGIHPGPTGHLLIAQELLRAWKDHGPADEATLDWKQQSISTGNLSDLKFDDTGVRFVWTARLPMPADPKWDERLVTMNRLGPRFNELTLTITDCPKGRYEIRGGDTSLGFTTDLELRNGLDLTRFPKLSVHPKRQELMKLVSQRQKILQFAWLNHVGHERPGVPKGLPLDEATAQAKELEQRIRALAKPAPLELRLLTVR